MNSWGTLVFFHSLTSLNLPLQEHRSWFLNYSDSKVYTSASLPIESSPYFSY